MKENAPRTIDNDVQTKKKTTPQLNKIKLQVRKTSVEL